MEMVKNIRYKDEIALDNSKGSVILFGEVRFDGEDTRVEFRLHQEDPAATLDPLKSVVVSGPWEDVARDMGDFSGYLGRVLEEKTYEESEPGALMFRSLNDGMLAVFMPSKVRRDCSLFSAFSLVESAVGRVGVRTFLLDVDDDVGNAFNLILDSMATMALAAKGDIERENDWRRIREERHNRPHEG